MKNARAAAESIDDYIATFPKNVQAKLEQVRAVIRKAAPDATEKISYRIHPLTKPMPRALIEKIVEFRLAENLAKHAARKRAR